MTRKTAIQGDPIVDEMRQIKERLAARYSYDAEAMLRDAQRRQGRHGRKTHILHGRVPARVEDRAR